MPEMFMVGRRESECREAILGLCILEGGKCSAATTVGQSTISSPWQRVQQLKVMFS